jgi:hypothetical protein
VRSPKRGWKSGRDATGVKIDPMGRLRKKIAWRPGEQEALVAEALAKREAEACPPRHLTGGEYGWSAAGAWLFDRPEPEET